MKGPTLILLGTLLSLGVSFSQENAELSKDKAERIEQLDRETMEREFRRHRQSKPFPEFPQNHQTGTHLKSGTEDVGNPPDWNWVRGLTGSGGADISDMVIDGSNNVYAYGTFSDSMRIGGTTLVSKGLRDVFIAKIGSFGSLTWIRQLEAVQDENLYSTKIALSSGGVVVSGSLESESVSGGGKLVCPVR